MPRAMTSRSIWLGEPQLDFIKQDSRSQSEWRVRPTTQPCSEAITCLCNVLLSRQTHSGVGSVGIMLMSRTRKACPEGTVIVGPQIVRCLFQRRHNGTDE